MAQYFLMVASGDEGVAGFMRADRIHLVSTLVNPPSREDEEFRADVQRWLKEHLVPPFSDIGDSFDLTKHGPERVEWERLLGAAGWIGIDWPQRYGGGGQPIARKMIFAEEYARAGGPHRNVFGEGMLGPTLMAFGTQAQRDRFLGPILRGTEIWCQGFSEPDAGSDLASLRTRAVLDGDEWVIHGQKIWTSFATSADWIFVLCRTSDDGPKHRGLSFLLCPMDQAAVSISPIRQLTGTSEFSQVFFDGARTSRDLIVGGIDQGWKVAMTTLGFERGTAFLGHFIRFQREFWKLIDVARDGKHLEDQSVRDRLARAYAELEVIRYNAARAIRGTMLPDTPEVTASLGKLNWSQWHQRLGVLEMDLIGMASTIVEPGYVLDGFQDTFLFSRAHTIYAGASEIQRNIIGERALGLPREPPPDLASRS